MIEPDYWIRQNAHLLGVDETLVNPASVDVRLSANALMSFAEGSTVPLNFRPDEDALLRPGALYLLCTEELVSVPDTHAAQLLLKSSRKREGLISSDVGWVDPGYTGTLTLPVTVAKPTRVRAGMRIAQLIFMRMVAMPEQPYQGHYQGSTGPTGSRTS
ncbi:hypothetical protein DM785_02450 [Deinococcus actinosclerus]|nr:hypothetical protein DM785_02450 [Deinococcus actinosclerus]